jgi:hypothetical protein
MYDMVNAFLTDAAASDRRDLLIMSSINRHSLLTNVPKFLQVKKQEVTPVKEENAG